MGQHQDNTSITKTTNPYVNIRNYTTMNQKTHENRPRNIIDIPIIKMKTVK